jgi:glycosyltransferase involved in cell wall biosynthesis
LCNKAVKADKITMIPYGADAITAGDVAPLADLNLRSGQFGVLIARPEPENSILEVVRAYSASRRAMPLVVLGHYSPEQNPYHAAVMAAASHDVRFVGAIYDKQVVGALRQHARFYVHGHQVGGTNPSLVEALGAGSPVLAHDNPFNRWVAADSARYFADASQCSTALDSLLADDGLIATLREQATRIHAERFTWQRILADYEALLEAWLPHTAAQTRTTPSMGQTS